MAKVVGGYSQEAAYKGITMRGQLLSPSVIYGSLGLGKRPVVAPILWADGGPTYIKTGIKKVDVGLPPKAGMCKDVESSKINEKYAIGFSEKVYDALKEHYAMFDNFGDNHRLRVAIQHSFEDSESYRGFYVDHDREFRLFIVEESLAKLELLYHFRDMDKDYIGSFALPLLIESIPSVQGSNRIRKLFEQEAFSEIGDIFLGCNTTLRNLVDAVVRVDGLKGTLATSFAYYDGSCLEIEFEGSTYYIMRQ